MTENKRGSRHWLVYILRCCDGSLYTGITNDLAKRLQAHQDGVASRYTRSRLPVKLVYLESAANRSAAAKRELAIKRMKRAQKERLRGNP
jgi:predicted GIY-YIG superfamily endonuclease